MWSEIRKFDYSHSTMVNTLVKMEVLYSNNRYSRHPLSHSGIRAKIFCAVASLIATNAAQDPPIEGLVIASKMMSLSKNDHLLAG
jgi:hypothetical protein